MSQTLEYLTEAELDALDEYLLSDAVNEEALDYIALHGYLCALSVSPTPMTTKEWLANALAMTPESLRTQQQDGTLDPAMLQLMQKEQRIIQGSLESDTALDIPCDLVLTLDEEGDCLLEYWAQGFVECVFAQENTWFANHEDLVTELLLPILLAANLDENDELAELRKQPKLCQQLCEQIPELVQDLFLLFRVPGELGAKVTNKRPH